MIQRNQLKRSALAVAIAIATSGAVLAQSNATGYVFGQVSGGGSVSVENMGTGQKRDISVDANGNYRASALAPGKYKVTYNGQSRDVTVNIGTGTAASFSDANTLGVVEVTGSAINPIDISSVESTTILTSEQIAKIPVGRNITNVALLAPGTVKGDAAFGNLASFGGSSVSENAYFVNGFNITNSFKALNFGQVPFEAIAEQQIKTGGYGAEFGRSTGGVINLVTKRGSNEFQAGANVFYTPESLRGSFTDVYENDGDLLSNNQVDRGSNDLSTSVWASGALIQDRLFAYALIQYGESNDRRAFGSRLGSPINFDFQNDSPTWLTKVDWNISDNHLLELTAFSDEQNNETDTYRSTGTYNDERGEYRGTTFDENGGQSYSLRYTGYLTDSFTLSALYGHGESSRSNYGIAANGIRSEYFGGVGSPVAGCPVVTDIRTAAVNGTVPLISGCNFVNGSVVGSSLAKDERNTYRIDGEWSLGDHLVRFGLEQDEFDSFDAESYEGGQAWRYQNPYTSGPAAGLGRVRRRVFQTGAGVGVNSDAFYVEDRWQITDSFMFYGGLRWDSFENLNGFGESFVKIDNQIAPRVGFSWDVKGDSSFKVFGNAGRYALPLTATVAVRGASASLYSEEFYSYTGVDPLTGAPTGLVNRGNPNCGGCDTRYLNNEFGVGKDPVGIADQNLDPMYQDEYIIGFQTQITDALTGGVRGIHRDLKRAIDDQCDYRPVLAWAEENGFDVSDPFSAPPATPDGAAHVYNPGFAFCHLYNPGSDATFLVDIDGNGTNETVHIAADVLGPKAIRKYNAIEFFAEGSWDNFFMQGSWTIAHSYGNTEGGVKSDIGQDDTGTTQDFDYPELAVGSYGDLPNDRRHSLKLFGNYSVNDEWSIGGNLLVQSGRPINCIGYRGGSHTSTYGASYFSCDPGPTATTADGDGDNGSTIVPRGSVGRTDWQRALDLNVTYRPAFADGKFALKADVFNVFDSNAAVSVSEAGEDGAGSPLLTSTYRVPTSFQAPRSVRFSAQYDF